MAKSLYDVLGVARDASIEFIRAAYRKAAKQHHPDSGGDPEKFSEIKVAHDVLSNPERRKRYDETGEVDASIISEQERVRLAAITFLAESFQSLLANENVDVATTDLRKLMLGRVNGEVEDVALAVKKAERLERRALASLKRFRREGSVEDNIFASLANNFLENVRGQLASARRHGAVMDAALAILGEYEYTVDSKPNIDPRRQGMTYSQDIMDEMFEALRQSQFDRAYESPFKKTRGW